MSETDTITERLPNSDDDPNQHTQGETSPARGGQTSHECQYHLNSNGGHSLGRDDPLWPRYVAEAEKWDDIMMNKWNSSMDVLLLFATLFSAIVTAFVIQTSQNLQPDNSAISASALVEIAGILRSIASGEQNITSPDVSQGSFQPSTTDYLVNLAWFVSLCLSITVALLASLVKQWCNSFLSDRTAPPCNQARIRQARLDRLISWRTELIVSALPVIMHIALALFLFGLILFLHDLHYQIFIVAVVITAVTATFYFVTTIVPFFVSFCPYETPLSSLKAWGFCYQVFLAIWLFIYRRFFDVTAQADLVTFMSPCEQQELKTSNNTMPDKVTGHALRWIILHSQRSQTREMAIRSIAGLQSEKALEQLIADTPGVFPQVVQSFTACFGVGLTRDGKHSGPMSIDDISLHGEALSRLVNLVTSASSRKEPDYLAKWGVDDDTKEAVTERFQRLAKNEECQHGKALGLIGLSGWYDFVDQGESRFNHGQLVDDLAQCLCQPLSNGLCPRILHALMVESAYWTPDVDGERRAKILNRLVDLIPTAPTGELRSRLACSLAVLTLALNPGFMHLQRPSRHTDAELEAGSARKPALRLADYYVNSPNNIVKDEQALLLFALTSLMQHYEHCDFDDQSQRSMKIVADQLSKIDDLGKSRRITLPKATGLDCDIRRYFVETLVLYLKQACPPFQSQTTDDLEVFVSLLESVNKRQVWVDHGSLITPPVIQILAQTDDTKLTYICLRTIVAHWELGPSLLYSRMLLSYEVPHKLVKLIYDAQVQNSNPPQEIRDLCITIPAFFGKLAEQVKAEELASDTDTDMLASLLERILQENLLETFVRHGLDLEIGLQTGSTQVEQVARAQSPEVLNALLLNKLFELRKAKISPQQPETRNPEQHGEGLNSTPTGAISGVPPAEGSPSGNNGVDT